MTVITAPFERVKVLLQLQGQKQLGPGEKPKYSGGTDVVRQLYKEGGIRSVYRGSVMTLARDGPGSAVYFATYETIKRRLTPKDENGKPGKLSIPAVMAAGGAAGVEQNASAQKSALMPACLMMAPHFACSRAR